MLPLFSEGEAPMFQRLAVFETAAQMAKHAGARQAVTARNIANADTPGYQATHILKFQEIAKTANGSTMRATRVGHLSASEASTSMAIQASMTESSPNGNGVSLEDEMMNAVEISREHNRALAVYRHAMTVLRTSIGR